MSPTLVVRIAVVMLALGVVLFAPWRDWFGGDRGARDRQIRVLTDSLARARARTDSLTRLTALRVDTVRDSVPVVVERLRRVLVRDTVRDTLALAAADTSTVPVLRGDLESAISNLQRCERLAGDCGAVQARLAAERDAANRLADEWKGKARDERRRRIFVRGVNLGVGACLTPDLQVRPCATVSYGVTFNPF